MLHHPFVNYPPPNIRIKKSVRAITLTREVKSENSNNKVVSSTPRMDEKTLPLPTTMLVRVEKVFT